MFQVLLLVAVLAVVAKAQDPATGWMAYAVGIVPDGVERITRLEMTWKVGESPKKSRAFFSPWFGMDPDDNLNLIQPVNPWSGSAWSMYTEYYQWKPTHNSNSKQFPVESGQTLHGTLIYDATTDSYDLSQTIVETGVSSTQNVPCQSNKKYNLPYIVYEKTFPCNNYPPDESVNFYDIIAECDGVTCTDTINWQSKIKDANCNMKAIIYNNTNISITWDTALGSKYDDMGPGELLDLNAHGWAKDYYLHSETGELVTTGADTDTDTNVDVGVGVGVGVGAIKANKLTCEMCKDLLPYVHTHECKSECSGWWDWTQDMCQAACNELTKYAPTTCCWDAGYCSKPL